MEKIHLRIDKDTSPSRVDVFLSAHLGIGSRSQLKARLVEIRLDGREVKASHRVKGGQELDVVLKPVEEPQFQAEPLPLSLLYEDSHVIVVNKPSGMVVHPGAGVRSGTLVQGLLYHIHTLKESFPGESIRPGIVHRLDKETSGVLIAAKDPATLEFLSAQFRKKSLRKTYLALVKGSPPYPEGRLLGRILRDPKNRKKFTMANGDQITKPAGKPMETAFRVLKKYDKYTLMVLEPRTGRTHQLRVQMQAFGCPIVGDLLYGKGARMEGLETYRLLLHAYSLEILLPAETVHRKFYAPLPKDFKLAIQQAASNLWK